MKLCPARFRPIFFCLVVIGLDAAPLLPTGTAGKPEPSPLSAWFMPPTRVVWTSATGVTHAQDLLGAKPGQAVLKNPSPPCVLAPAASGAPGGGILLDFGTELTGNIEIITPITKEKNLPRVRIRFGESVAEAMAELGGEPNAQNDDAVRDQTVRLPWLGKITVGPSGFRFVRIDNVGWTSIAAAARLARRVASMLNGKGCKRG